MKNFLWVCVIAVGLSGCATSLDGQRYLSIEPSFDLFQFFDGEVKAWGLVQNRDGEVIQKFEVDIQGSIMGDQITLDETFQYAVGKGPTKRAWRIVRLDAGPYRGTAGDILGEAVGSTYGNAFRWSYRMDIPVDDTVYEVSFEDWFWVIDDRRLFNRSYIQKFGFDVAEVTIFMERQ
ncbi:MAG: DUF3833 domain-containing protein [Litorivicinaceae bacterium]